MENSREVFAKNLRYQLMKNKKSQNDLAHAIGVSKTTISEWLSGKKYPRVDKLQTIADYFDIYRSDLTDEKQDLLATKLPVYKNISSDFPIMNDTNIIGTEDFPSDLTKPTDYFALLDNSNTMMPFKGIQHIVIARKQNYAKDGDIAVVLIDNDDAIIRQVKKEKRPSNIKS